MGLICFEVFMYSCAFAQLSVLVLVCYWKDRSIFFFRSSISQLVKIFAWYARVVNFYWKQDSHSSVLLLVLLLLHVHHHFLCIFKDYISHKSLQVWFNVSKRINLKNYVVFWVTCNDLMLYFPPWYTEPFFSLCCGPGRFLGNCRVTKNRKGFYFARFVIRV